MSARANILQRLRAHRPAELPALPDVAGWFAARRRDETVAQRLSRLRAALESVKAEVHETTATDWPALLVRLASAKGVRKLLLGSDTAHGAALAATPAPGLQWLSYQKPVETWRTALFEDIDAALTTARGALADPGCLILWPSASEPRLMSLVPPIHFVLLDAPTIHADFDAAMRAEDWPSGLPANALLISGPSKTADIQQTLAYGAHGPRELVVLVRHAAGAGA